MMTTPTPAQQPDYTRNRGAIFTAGFWKDTTDRTIRTAAQAALGLLGADGLGWVDVDFGQVASVSGLAALAAVLFCVAAGTASPETGASTGTTVPRDNTTV